ncbi:MAG: hypothetical protein ACKOW9_04520 [Candidatus Paceibacterota bacterium]
MNEKKTYTAEELKQAKDRYVTKIFWLCLNMVVIFLVPALIAVYIGKRLQALYSHIENLTSFLLLFSFIFSWVVVFYYYRFFSKKMRALDEQSKQIKENTLSGNNINKTEGGLIEN